jgi:hypothetical protein
MDEKPRNSNLYIKGFISALGVDDVSDNQVTFSVTFDGATTRIIEDIKKIVGSKAELIIRMDSYPDNFPQMQQTDTRTMDEKLEQLKEKLPNSYDYINRGISPEMATCEDVKNILRAIRVLGEMVMRLAEIVEGKPERTVTSYRCVICGKQHPTADGAGRCCVATEDKLIQSYAEYTQRGSGLGAYEGT